MKLGVHTSIAGGIDKALDRADDLACNTLQIFSSNPRGWKIKSLSKAEVNKVREKLIKYQLEPLVIHAPYLINLASDKDKLYQKSITALTNQLKRADRLGAKYFVLHPGSHVGSGKEAGIKRIGLALDKVISENDFKVNILLENVAGAGTALGSTIKDLAAITDLISDSKKIGLCFDTCHGFTAGYHLNQKGLEELLKEIEDYFGLDKLAVVHLNDSKKEFNSNKDRHQHIGQGEIGLDNFANLINHGQLKDKIFIMETPVDDVGDDKSNLALVKQLIR